MVVDYNGGDLTMRCLEHLTVTDHPTDALEVVLVDNASQRSVAKQVRADFPTVRIIESQENLGFGGGCNLGMGNVDEVDYVALVNNDATVPPGWLQPLLETLESDPTLGAASPKILLARRYRELRITAATTRAGRGDARDLGIRISGARAGDDDLWRDIRFPDGTFGPELDAAGVEYHWTTGDARLLVPSADGASSCGLRLDAPNDVTVTVTSGDERVTFSVGPDPTWYGVPSDGDGFDVVNNVGTHLVADGYAADRGWLERDRGQYERGEDVFAWCGAAVLLRATYLLDIGPFDERLFLYSEDLELAWRGLQRGWRHRYVPRSVVRHVHSATSSRSARAATLKERNRLLVLLRHGSARLIARGSAALRRRHRLLRSPRRRRATASRCAGAADAGQRPTSGLRGIPALGSRYGHRAPKRSSHRAPHLSSRSSFGRRAPMRARGSSCAGRAGCPQPPGWSNTDDAARAENPCPRSRSRPAVRGPRRARARPSLPRTRRARHSCRRTPTTTTRRSSSPIRGTSRTPLTPRSAKSGGSRTTSSRMVCSTAPPTPGAA